MKYLYNSLKPFTLEGNQLFAEIRTDGTQLHLKIEPVSDATSSGTVSYNGETQTFWLGYGKSTTLYFEYSDSVKTATISTTSGSFVCTWSGSLADPDPIVSVGYTGVRVNSNITTTFDYSESGDYNALVATKMYTKSLDADWTLHNYSAPKNTTLSYSEPIVYGNTAGTLYKYILLFASYENDGDATENYIGLQECELPVFTLTAEDTPFAPCGLTYSSGHSGMPLPVSWNAVNDPDFTIDEYVLTRCVDGSTFTEVYRGSSPCFTDTPPATAKRVKYNVCSVSDDIYSEYTEGAEVELVSSNIYVGSGGQVCPAVAVFIGKGNLPAAAGAVATVGG